MKPKGSGSRSPAPASRLTPWTCPFVPAGTGISSVGSALYSAATIHQRWCVVLWQWKGIHSPQLCYERKIQLSRSSSTNACKLIVTSQVLGGSYQIKSPKRVEAYRRRLWILTMRGIKQTSPSPFPPSLSMLILKASNAKQRSAFNAA